MAQAAAAARALGLPENSFSYPVQYNVAPTSSVPIVRCVGGRSHGTLARWGLVPRAAGGHIPPGPPLSIATVEKLERWSGWQRPWERGQRCILPAYAFYEWHWNERTGALEPFAIRAEDDARVLGFAGLWEESGADDAAPLLSCALITVPANALMRRLHNSKVIHGRRTLLPPEQRRMPAILAPEDYETWLTVEPPLARRCLRPYPEDRMQAWQVSSRVNNTQVDEAALLTPMSDAQPDLFG